MGFHSLVNTALFSQTARDYVKNGNKYCLAPRGSRDYHDFWEEEERRCLQGYRVGDLWITGRHYFYLNYTPIWRVPDDKLAQAQAEVRSGKPITAEKELTFPKFWEIDYEWFNFKHIAWYGGQFMGVNSPGGRHLCCLKTRGAGFSYKEASDGVYNYTFIDGSKSYYFAGLEEYLIKDGILNKVNDMLEFINKESLYLRLNRGKKNTIMHQKATYLTEEGYEEGPGSEIIGVTVDNPNKTRGKRGRKIVFEEAGSFKNLKSALEICQGSIRSGSFYIGQISIFGTGGEEGPGIEGLDEIYNNPEAWDMLSFPNVYDEMMEATECGYFVPCYRANEAAFDNDGNIDIPLAIELDKIERAKKKKSKDPKALDKRKAEFPRNASEALMRISFNMFNIAEIDKQMKRLNSNPVLQGYLRHGTLVQGTKGPEFVPLPHAKPITQYPHKNTDDLTGCITVFEKPITISYLNDDNEMVMGTPPDVYFMTVDPVYKEEADDLTSLFDIRIWKQYNDYDPVNQGVMVAWYTHRPKSLEDTYRMLFMMAEWYNCKVQSEIAGGGQGIFDYAKRKHLLHKLEFDVILDNKEISMQESSKNRSIFMNVSKDMKLLGLRYYADYTMEVRGINTEGGAILNMHTIMDIAMLREMRKYNDKRNADRVSNAILAMFMLKKKALEKAMTEEVSSERNFYNRTLFGGGGYRPSSGTTTAY